MIVRQLTVQILRGGGLARYGVLRSWPGLQLLNARFCRRRSLPYRRLFGGLRQSRRGRTRSRERACRSFSSALLGVARVSRARSSFIFRSVVTRGDLWTAGILARRPECINTCKDCIFLLNLEADSTLKRFWELQLCLRGLGRPLQASSGGAKCPQTASRDQGRRHRRI